MSAAGGRPLVPSPLRAALACRCPRCGRGRLFAGFLALAPTCELCGLDYGAVDAGDGPAVFLIFTLGALVVPLALLAEVRFAPPLWLHMAIWAPLVLGLALGLLRPLKAAMIALQFRYRAGEPPTP